MKTRPIIFTTTLLALASFVVSQSAQAVRLPLNGDYENGNTVLSGDALFSVTTGSDYAAVGLTRSIMSPRWLQHGHSRCCALFIQHEGPEHCHWFRCAPSRPNHKIVRRSNELRMEALRRMNLHLSSRFTSSYFDVSEFCFCHTEEIVKEITYAFH